MISRSAEGGDKFDMLMRERHSPQAKRLNLRRFLGRGKMVPETGLRRLNRTQYAQKKFILTNDLRDAAAVGTFLMCTNEAHFVYLDWRLRMKEPTALSPSRTSHQLSLSRSFFLSRA